MSALRCVLSSLLLACHVTGTIGRDDPEGGGSGGGTVGGMEEDGAATQGEVGGTAEGEGSGAGMDGGSSSSSSPGGSSESTAAIPHACIPTPDDGECAHCRKTSCCEHLEACVAHEPCVCWWECVQVDEHTADECALACGTDHQLYEGLETCTHDNCAACL